MQRLRVEKLPGGNYPFSASTPALRLRGDERLGGRDGQQASNAADVEPEQDSCIHARPNGCSDTKRTGVEVGVSADACRLSPDRVQISHLCKRLTRNSSIHVRPGEFEGHTRDGRGDRFAADQHKVCLVQTAALTWMRIGGLPNDATLPRHPRPLSGS